jgi:hypothetical protein
LPLSFAFFIVFIGIDKYGGVAKEERSTHDEDWGGRLVNVSSIGYGRMSQYAYTQGLASERVKISGAIDAAQAGQAVSTIRAAAGERAVTGPVDANSPEQVGARVCQTCKNRKYQDGSNDPGVSFKTPAHIDPGSAQSVVRGHEQEHVSNQRAKAQSENRRIISQSVSLFTSICPECGRVYVSGGVTRTVTASADNNAQNYGAEGRRRGQLLNVTA